MKKRKPILITTPFPTLGELFKIYKISKKHQKEILAMLTEIVDKPKSKPKPKSKVKSAVKKISLAEALEVSGFKPARQRIEVPEGLTLKCDNCGHDLHCTWCPEFCSGCPTCGCFDSPGPVRDGAEMHTHIDPIEEDEDEN
jgi:rubrerythrin